MSSVRLRVIPRLQGCVRILLETYAQTSYNPLLLLLIIRTFLHLSDFKVVLVPSPSRIQLLQILHDNPYSTSSPIKSHHARYDHHHNMFQHHSMLPSLLLRP